MNINGRDGPILKKIFTCEKCIFLSNAFITLNNTMPYQCVHDSILKNKYADLWTGDIDANKITPDFCPFLLSKTRFEKLKELKGLN